MTNHPGSAGILEGIPAPGGFDEAIDKIVELRNDLDGLAFQLRHKNKDQFDTEFEYRDWKRRSEFKLTKMKQTLRVYEAYVERHYQHTAEGVLLRVYAAMRQQPGLTEEMLQLYSELRLYLGNRHQLDRETFRGAD